MKIKNKPKPPEFPPWYMELYVDLGYSERQPLSKFLSDIRKSYNGTRRHPTGPSNYEYPEFTDTEMLERVHICEVDKYYDDGSEVKITIKLDLTDAQRQIIQLDYDVKLKAWQTWHDENRAAITAQEQKISRQRKEAAAQKKVKTTADLVNQYGKLKSRLEKLGWTDEG